MALLHGLLYLEQDDHIRKYKFQLKTKARLHQPITREEFENLY